MNFSCNEYFFSIFLILFLHPLFAHKTEVKFLIPDLSKMPSSILDALQTGRSHQDISRRGSVIQQYVAVTKKNIFKIFRELQTADIPFGSDGQMSDFLFSGKVQEIRLMRKDFKKGGRRESPIKWGFKVMEKFQVTQLRRLKFYQTYKCRK